MLTDWLPSMASQKLLEEVPEGHPVCSTLDDQRDIHSIVAWLRGDERALILAGVLGRSLKSVNIKSLPEVTLDVKADGQGIITFGSRSLLSGSSWPGTAQSSSPAFEMIENVSQVYQMIQSVQHK